MGVPKTLPADFTGFDAGGPPQSLPADFSQFDETPNLPEELGKYTKASLRWASPFKRAVQAAAAADVPRPEFMRRGELAPFTPEQQALEANPPGLAELALNVATNPQLGAEHPLPKTGTATVEGVSELGTPGKRLGALAKLIGAGGETLSPILGIGALEAPVSTGIGLATGLAAGKTAKAATKRAGGGEQAQELAETVGFWLPALAGAMVRPRVGVAITPEEVVVRGGVAPRGMEPMAGEVRIPRGPRPPAAGPAGLAPPTIEAIPPTPPEPAVEAPQPPAPAPPEVIPPPPLVAEPPVPVSPEPAIPEPTTPLGIREQQALAALPKQPPLPERTEITGKILGVPPPAEDIGAQTRREVERRMGGPLPRGQAERRSETYYHGTNNPEQIRTQGFARTKGEGSSYLGDNYAEGIYLSKSKTPYEEGGQLADVSVVLPAKISATKIKAVNGPQGILDLQKRYGIGALDEDASQKLTTALEKDGYEGLDIGNEVVIFDPSKVRVAEAQPPATLPVDFAKFDETPPKMESPADEKIAAFFERVAKRVAQEGAGQQILDEMEENNISPKELTKHFWEDTYFKLPAEVQGRFRNYLKKETSFVPGDVIGTTKDGQPIVARDWADIAENILDVGDNPAELEGTTRGLVALMQMAESKLAGKPPEAVTPEQKQLPAETKPPVPETAPAPVETKPAEPTPEEIAALKAKIAALEQKVGQGVPGILKGKKAKPTAEIGTFTGLEIRGTPTTGYSVWHKATNKKMYTAGFNRALAEKFLAEHSREEVPRGQEVQKPEEGQVTAPVSVAGKGIIGALLPKPERFEAGKKLTPEERRKVLGSLVDVYKEKQAPIEEKGTDSRTGDIIYGYKYSPELFEKSHITGAGVRYYIKLPDGRLAHPSELYPEITESQIDAEMAQRRQAEKDEEYFRQTKNNRIINDASDKNEANKRYHQTNRKIEGSYFAQDSKGRLVRVDGKDPKDVAHYEQLGFTRITEPVPAKTAPTTTGEIIRTPEQTTEQIGRPSEVRLIDPHLLKTDPSRFQWRIVPRSAIPETAPWDQTKAGPLDVWPDPENGTLYVVEGHHRHQHALRTKPPEVEIRLHHFANAAEARQFGALRNLELGNATPFDAALYLRESKMTPKDLEARGVNLTGDVLRKGSALANLSDAMWQKYRTGDVSEPMAVAIGSNLDDPKQQDALLKLAKSRRLSSAEIEQQARRIKDQGNTSTTVQGLFGAEEHSVSNAIETGRLALKVEKSLQTDKQALKYIANASEARKAALERGKNIVNVEKSSEEAMLASALAEHFRRVQNKAGEVSRLLEDGGRRVTQGERADGVFNEIYPQIRKAILDELGAAQPGRSEEGKAGAGVRAEGRPAEKEPALYSPEVAPIFYSKAARVAFEKLPASAPGNSILATLKNAGVKDEEIKWTGLDDFLKDKPKVPKSEVLSYLMRNMVQVRETTLGARTPEQAAAIEQAREEMNTAHFEFVDRMAKAMQELGVEANKVEAQRGAQLAAAEIEEGMYSSDVISNYLDHKLKEGEAMAEPGASRELFVVGALLSSKRYNFKMARRDNQFPTKYEGYTLPGEKQNYRELLLTLPQARGQVTFEPSKVEIRRNRRSVTQGSTAIYYDGELLGSYSDDPTLQPGGSYKQRSDDYWMQVAKDIFTSGDQRNAIMPRSGAFKSAHFDQPNILAHVRFDDRTDADGKKVLFVEEVQSDWHEAGRKKGYADPAKRKALEAELADLKKQHDALEDKLKVANNWLDKFIRDSEPEMKRDNLSLMSALERHGLVDKWNEREALWPEFKAIKEREDTIRHWELNPERQGVPNAPFKTTWHELALKRMIRYAAENGYDKIAFTTGEQQADRYSLARHVEQIEVSPRTDADRKPDGRNVVIHLSGQGSVSYIDLGVDQQGIVDNATGTRTDVQLVGKPLSDVVGKEMAARIMGNNRQKIEGEGLKIGGEGMKGFYDKIIPDFLNKYGKKWGARVGEIQIRLERKDWGDAPEGLTVEQIRQWHKEQEMKAKENLESVHALTVTPEMKRSVVQEGQPLFRQQPLITGRSPEAMREIADRAQATIVRPGNKVPNYVRVNQYAMQLIGEAHGSRFRGVNMGAAAANDLLAELEDLKYTHKSPEAQDKIDELTATLRKAIDPINGLNIVKEGQTPAQELETVMEEGFHSGVQRRTGSGFIEEGVPYSTMALDPGIRAMAERIAGYELQRSDATAPVVVAEAMADIFVGDAIELSPQQAQATAEKYYSLVAEKYGPEPLEVAQALYDYADQWAADKGIIQPGEQYEPVATSPGRAALDAVLARSRTTGEPRPEAIEARSPRSTTPYGPRAGEISRGFGTREATSPSLASSEPIGLTDEELADWSKSRGFRYEPAGEQLGMFGGNEPIYRVTRIGKRGKEERGLVYQSQIDRLSAPPTQPTEPFALTSGEGPQETQPRLFGAGDLGEIIGSPQKPASRVRPQAKEEPSLFRPERDIEKAIETADKEAKPQGAFAQSLARAKAAGQALLHWYLKGAVEYTDFDKALRAWDGAKQIAGREVKDLMHEAAKAVPDRLAREAIVNVMESGGDDPEVLTQRASEVPKRFKAGYEKAKNLSESELAVAKTFRNLMDDALDLAKKEGVLEHGVEDYIQHIWKSVPERAEKFLRQIYAELNISSLQPNPSFTRQRVWQTYFEGEKYGAIPQQKDAVFLVGYHLRSLYNAIADRAFIKGLFKMKASDGRPMAIVGGGVRAPEGGEAVFIKPQTKTAETGDYQYIHHPALRRWKWVGEDPETGKTYFMQGDVYIHPEIVGKLRNIFGRSAIREFKIGPVHPGRGILAFSSGFKNVLLQGIPSFFHETTVRLHAAEHRVFPVGVKKYDLNDPETRDLIRAGLKVFDGRGFQEFSEGLAPGAALYRLPGLGKFYQWYSERLFENVIPNLKVAMAKEALARNLKRYPNLSRDQALMLTADESNAAFGEQNYTALARNKTVQDALRIFFLAPDFFEARARFVGQALRPYGREQLVALALGAAVIYTLGRILNQMLDNDLHLDRPFSAVVNGHEYSLRTIQGDVLHAIKRPGQFIMVRLHPATTRGAIEGLTGRNEWGMKRSPSEQFWDFVHRVVPIPTQALVTQKGMTRQRQLIKSFLQTFGINEMAYRTEAEQEAMWRRTPTPSSAAKRPQADRMREYWHQIEERQLNRKRLDEDVRNHILTPADRAQLLRGEKRSRLSSDIRSMTLDDALDIWDKMTPQERKENLPVIRQKAMSELNHYPPGEEKEQLRERIRIALMPKQPPPGYGALFQRLLRK